MYRLVAVCAVSAGVGSHAFLGRQLADTGGDDRPESTNRAPCLGTLSVPLDAVSVQPIGDTRAACLESIKRLIEAKRLCGLDDALFQSHFDQLAASLTAACEPEPPPETELEIIKREFESLKETVDEHYSEHKQYVVMFADAIEEIKHHRSSSSAASSDSFRYVFWVGIAGSCVALGVYQCFYCFGDFRPVNEPGGRVVEPHGAAVLGRPTGASAS